MSALAAGASFDATNLGLRRLLGVPSLPEAMSDLLVPFIPASLFGQLLSRLGPYGKQIVLVSSLLGLGLGVAIAVGFYRGLIRRWGLARATGALLVVGWVLLTALFWSVIGANDAGGTLLARQSLGVLDLGLCSAAAAIVAVALVGLPALDRRRADAPTAVGRRRVLGGLGAAVAMLAIGGGGVLAGVRQLMKLSNLGYEGYGTPAAALGAFTPNRNFYVIPGGRITGWGLERSVAYLAARRPTMSYRMYRGQKAQDVNLGAFLREVAPEGARVEVSEAHGSASAAARWRPPTADRVPVDGVWRSRQVVLTVTFRSEAQLARAAELVAERFTRDDNGRHEPGSWWVPDARVSGTINCPAGPGTGTAPFPGAASHQVFLPASFGAFLCA